MNKFVVQKINGRYYKPCPKCGIQQSYLRKNYAQESLRLNKLCKSCSNKKTENSHRGWHKGIRISWYNKFKTGAETRGKKWLIDIEDVYNVMKKQNYKCALTGLPIDFPESGHPQKSTASIDRIDSKKDYEKNNIQLVVKKINMMKQNLTQEEFIYFCKLIAKEDKKTSGKKR